MRWIALLRGVNVGGHNKLPMATLRAQLEAAGLEDVSTYIQSGNLVFDAEETNEAAIAALVGDVIENEHGFRPATMVMTVDELRRAADLNPFPDATDQPTSLHLSFLSDAPDTERIDTLREIASATETLEVINRVLYLHAPDGIGRSKLAARVDNVLGVHATGRNWRTITKLLELAG